MRSQLCIENDKTFNYLSQNNSCFSLHVCYCRKLWHDYISHFKSLFCIARQVLIYASITKPRLANSLLVSDRLYESLRCQNKSNERNIYCTPLSGTDINNCAVNSLYSSGGETWLFLPCNIWKWVDTDHSWYLVQCSLQGKLELHTTVASSTQLCLGSSTLCCSVQCRQIKNNLPVFFIVSKY